MFNLTVDEAHTFYVGTNGWLVHNCSPGGAGNIANQVCKSYEQRLQYQLGGQGSFKLGGREFDGAYGDIWYEAKVGGYWQNVATPGEGFRKFQSDMGARHSLARSEGKQYMLYSDAPIPQYAKDWLDRKVYPMRRQML